MKRLKDIFELLKETVSEWSADNAPRLAAALSYYTAFSIAPLLIVIIAIASLVFQRDVVTGRLDNQIQSLVGPTAADAVQEILANAQQPGAGLIATIVGVVTLLLGAAGVFTQLKGALNTIWDVEPPKNSGGILKTIKDQFVSFAMVLVIGFLLMVSLIVSTVLSAANDFIIGLMPGAQFLAQLINFAVSLGVITLLFALIFKVLPDTDVKWGDVWIGAVVTALLFTVGKLLLGLYLGNSTVASSYGAAGSFVVLLLWIYYSAQILFFGAEFTQVYAKRRGSKAGQQTVMEAAVAPTGAVAPVSTPKVEPVVVYQPIPPTPEELRRTFAPELSQMGPDRRPEARDYLGMALALVTAALTFIVGVVLGKDRRPKPEPMNPLQRFLADRD